MLKTINDILKAVGLADGTRAALLTRIKDKYKIVPASNKYRYEFSEEDYNRIVRLETKRKKTYPSGNFNRKYKSMYYEYKEKSFYSRLTYYGGIK